MAGLKPRIALICHKGSALNRDLLPRWLASFGHVVGIVELDEHPKRLWYRLRFEHRRIGSFRLLDVLAMRAFYRIFWARRDMEIRQATLARLSAQFQPISTPPTITAEGPNTKPVQEFLRQAAPDIVLARCKRLLSRATYEIPTVGAFVLHPGVCPEYRNAHGCFWALATDDLANVGATLLKIDEGIDTGPIYGYFSYDFDELTESHMTIMDRVVTENLDPIRDRLLDIWHGRATPIPTAGRTSAVWGQPWLTRFLYWKQQARRRSHG